MSEMERRNGQKPEYSTSRKRKDFWFGFLVGLGLILIYLFLGIGLQNLGGQSGWKSIIDLAGLAALAWLAIHLIRIKRHFYLIGGLVAVVAMPLLVFGACLAMLSGSGF